MTYGNDLEPEATATHTPSEILEEVEERDRFDEGIYDNYRVENHSGVTPN